MTLASPDAVARVLLAGAECLPGCVGDEHNVECVHAPIYTGTASRLLAAYVREVRLAALAEARNAACTFCACDDEPTMGMHYPKFGEGTLQLPCNAMAIRTLIEAG